MKTEIRFLCLKCGKTATVPLRNAIVLKDTVRCYFPPQGWAILYPPENFPTRSGVCADCVLKATQEAAYLY